MIGAEGILVLEDEALLRNVICEVLEASIPGVRTRPATTRGEASTLLALGDIAQIVSEVTIAGSNISPWLSSTLLERPCLSLVTFSILKPWLPGDLLESPRVMHVDKQAGGIQQLVFACRELLA